MPGRLLVGGFVILALVLLAYLPILPGSFLMDDRRLVESDNPLVNGSLTPMSIWFQTDFALSTFLFWLQWLAWGNHPGWYHVINMLLHALSAVMLWRILVRLEIPAAWLAGALFAVHPVCVNSVARIAELKNTLSLPFFLLSFWLYLPNLGFAKPSSDSSNRAALRYGLSLLAFVLALMSKTSTVMLPFVFLAVALWHNERLTRKDFLRASPFFVVALAFGLMSAWFQKHQAMAGPVLAPESFWLRLITAGRIFWFYLGKALLPLRLNLVYPEWKTDGISPVSFLPLLFIFGAVFICWRVRRGWGRHVLLMLGVFGITLFRPSVFLTRNS